MLLLIFWVCFFFLNLLESLATHLLFNNGKIKHIPLIFME